MTDFKATKALFHLPEGVTYLDGNSLGAMPKTVAARVSGAVTDEWGELLITGWNKAGWMDLPANIGDRIAGLIGAPAGSVTIGDTLTIKVYQALAAALQMRPDRRVILSDNGNFPTDLYIAQGLIHSLDKGHEIRTPDPEDVEAAINEDVAVLMLTEVDYRTGRRHDMKRLTAKAQAAGAVVIWDLAHSAGAFAVEMEKSNAEFACGCTYKYLNGGPGAPAFIYVRPDLAETVRPALSGWLGHEAPFDFDLDYRPGAGVSRMRVGTPPVLQMAALEEALKVWDGVDMADLRTRSVELTDLFIAEVEARCPAVTLASPRDSAIRGSQVTFRHPEGFAVMQALVARGVIGDFRAPDGMRFGFAPLYNDEADVTRAATALQEILDSGEWDQPKYRVRGRVT